MSTQEKTKTAETLTTLKNANRHMTEIINKIESMNTIMGSVRDNLSNVADNCGDLFISAYTSEGWKTIKLKDHLKSLSAKLSEGRM